VKSFELCEVPVRCAKFIVRKQWIVAATDDMHLRVFNTNTMEKVKEWEAHTDYIRFVEVHPNRSVFLSSSDDMSIKLWDWDKNFDCIQVFEGHSHYVMMVRINPRDTNTFASASLDRTIKVWGLTANTPHFSLESHEKGVNCVDYYPGGDKPYLLSGADDHVIKIWDYQTRTCLQSLLGHSHNISAVCFHPRLPLIISASEDGTVRLWHSTTYRPESTLNYGMERAWALAPTPDANKLAIGYDEGTIVLKLGNEKPVASLDTNSGKIVWARGHDIQTISLKGLNKAEVSDGEKVAVSPKDLGACEVYPQTLVHNRNGQFIVVLGDGEYIIYTSQSLRNKGFGTALDFVWSSQGTGDYAVRESINRIKIFKNFKEFKQITLPISSAEGICGGTCLAVKGSDCVLFYDWEEGEFIRKIDVVPRNIYWNDSGDMLVISCEDSYFVLKYQSDVVATALSGSRNSRDENGVDGSFELEYSMNDKVRTGQWVGDCFLFTNTSGRLNYFVGGQVMTLFHMDHPMYLLGFVPKEDRVFLIDKTYNIISHRVYLSVLNYQTAVVRQDFETANSILPSIPKSEYVSIARFLESQGFKEEALAVTPDLEHRFELAIDLHNLQIAHSVLLESDKTYKNDPDYFNSTESQSKWKRLGDLALSQGQIDLAQQCAERSGDLSGQLLLYASSGNKDGVRKLALQAKDTGRSNVAFLSFFVTGQIEECIQLLIETNRIPEAAFLARTYMPSMVSSVLQLWKSDLKLVNEKAAEALADPEKYPNLFPDLEWALKVFISSLPLLCPRLTLLLVRSKPFLNLPETTSSPRLPSPPPKKI
jgi:coatomer subunit beta'